MTNQIVTIHNVPQLTAKTRRAMLAGGFWMRVAFVGASATAIGVIQLFDGEWSALLALGTAAAGAALAALSWRRAHAALSDIDAPDTAPVTSSGASRVRSAVGA